MDALTGFFAKLLASTGLAVNTELILVAAFALAVMIVAIGLALSRRRDRFVDSELGVVGAHKAVAAVSSDLDEFHHHLGSENSEKSEPSSELARLATDPGSMREAVATNLPSTKAELITLQELVEEESVQEESVEEESVQEYQAGIELLQATLISLQREQLTLHKLLEACNARFKGIEQLVAAVPSLRTEHASIKKQLTELNARFDAASELLADFLQSEDLPDDH